MAETFSLSEDFRRERREQQENFRLSVANQQQHDPDRSRRILSVSLATGLPGEVADADLDNLEKLVTSREFDVDKWRKESPAWTSFASENPYHLAVLKEDQEQMGALERSIKQIGLGWDSTWATVELGRLRSRQLGGDVRDGDEERLKELKELTVAHEFGAENPVVKFLVKNAKMAGPTIHSIKEGLTLGLGGASVGAASGALAGPGAPIGVPAAAGIGFTAGFTTGTARSSFQLERGFAYDEYLEMGVDPVNAKIAANSVGLINAGLETLAIGKVVKYVPWLRGNPGKKIAADVLSKPTVAGASLAVVGRFGEVLGTEVVTEVLQESVTMAAGEIVRDDGESLEWDEYIDRVSDVAMETLQGAAIMSSFGPAMSYYSDLKRASNAKNMASIYKALGDSAKDSTTRSKLPGKYQEFVNRLTKDGPLKSLFVDAERFNEYFQEAGQDPSEVARTLGVKNLEEAIETGGDVEIPIGAYADKIAPTEAHNGLMDDLRADINDMSAREAADFERNKQARLKEVDEILQSVEETHTAERNEVMQDVMGQLIAANVSRGAAKQQAELTAAAFATLGERMNMSPKALFKQFFGGVKSVQDPALAVKDVDALVDPLLNRLRKGDIPQDRDIFGQSLTEFLKSRGGIWDEGGELHARDLGKQVPFLLRKGGMTIDGAAEAAHESGFIAERDENLLLEALDKETRGEPVFGPDANPEMEQLRNTLNELGDFLDQEGIDLETMSNAEVRKKLQEGRSFNQLEDSELLDLSEFITKLVSGGANPELLGQIEGAIPRIDDKQDFSGVEFTDTVRVEGTTEQVTVTQSAQQTFERAVKKRNVLKRLMDCVSG